MKRTARRELVEFVFTCIFSPTVLMRFFSPILLLLSLDYHCETPR